MRHFAFTLSLLVFAIPLLANPVQESELDEEVDISRSCGKPSKCGTKAYPSNTGSVTPDPILNSPQVWSFVSAPNLHPMKVTVNTYLPGTSSGFIFVAPYAFSDNATYGQTGSLMMDNDGNPIWFRPLNTPNLMNTDFRVQKLAGKRVLTFWQGTLVTPPVYTNAPGGSSEPGSCYYILDNTYRVIKNVEARKGFISDIHEFLLTPQNTALFLSTKVVPMDLTPYGGPENGSIQDFAIQEIDLKTNQLIFFWDALDHIPLTDSYEPASSASGSNNIWDVYHLNSIGLTDSKRDILVSGRNTWTIYRINKPTGNIIWHLGGKQNDFTMGSGATFSWQHDARFLPGDVISLFDDNCCESSLIPPSTPPAHGLLLYLNLADMTANAISTYFHDPLLQIGSQGNVQSLPNGNKFVGWGESQYYSEYAEAGNTVDNPAVDTLYDAKMPGSNYTYRAYRSKWVGRPHYPPSIAVQSNSGQITVYASWNGSTNTAAWKVFAGSCPDHLNKITTAKKTGFETAIAVTNSGPYFKVKALNAKGKVIGVSKVVQLNTNSN
jgi:hypothetical protein